MSSPAAGSGNGSGAPAASAEPSAPREFSFSRTATGIRSSLDGITVDADHPYIDRYGQKAIVTVRWSHLLCHRDRINLDDFRQRKKFADEVRERAQTKLQKDPATILANSVIEDLLLQLSDECRKQPEKSPTDPETKRIIRAKKAAAAEQRACLLLNDPDILSRVREAIEAQGYVGDPTPALLVYIALTSRLLERPINLALVADSSAGKNLTIDVALKLMPRKAVYVFSAGSPRSVIYTRANFRNRTVVFKEADSIPSDASAASAVRALAEDNRLQYEVTAWNPTTGRFETRKITKQGPTGLITTSTRALRHQLSTRVLRVPMAVDVETTHQVMASKAKRAARNTASPPRLAPCLVRQFRALQRWLDLAGERRVVVPFGEELAALMPMAQDVRIRRDFEKLLTCVKTIALLRQRHRARTPSGEIAATIDDYKTAHELLEKSFYATADEVCPPVVRETVDAIGRTEQRLVSEADLAKRLGLAKQTISWRVRKALEKGWLVNVGPRNSRPYRLKRGVEMPGDVPAIPEVHHVEGLYEGVPLPGPIQTFPETVQDRLFGVLAHELSSEWPAGVTAAEWAAAVKRDVQRVRARLDVLVAAHLLIHDSATGRYGVFFWAPFGS